MNKLKAILHHLRRLPFEIFILVAVMAAVLLSSVVTQLWMSLMKLVG